MKPYPKYKDSGVEWLGQIPAHWVMKKIKYIAELKSGDNITSDQISDNGNYPVYGGNGLRGYYDSYTHEGAYTLIGRQGALCGNINYASGKFWASEHAVIATFKGEYELKWFGELLRAMNLNQYSVSAAQPGLSVDNIKNLSGPVPSKNEQATIAAYLDRKTTEIDKLIANKERLIELYEEEKKAVINQAVTKGLDPDADMKDSGVEWLGEVPAHWEVKRINSLFSESNAKPSNETELNYPFLTISIHNGISDRELKENELDRKVTRSEDKSLYKIVQENYLAYNMMRAWQGGFGASKLSGLVSPAYVICKPITSIDSYFFELVLRTPNAIAEMRRFSRGIVDFRLRLYWDDFKNISVPVPPDGEIKRILDHIETTNSTFSKLSSLAMRKIELLKEYRTALISEAVTGKIDVRDN